MDARAEMKALRDRLEADLLENESYRALKAIDRAIAEIDGDVTVQVNLGRFPMKPSAFSPRQPPARLRERGPSQADASYDVLKQLGFPVPIGDLVDRARERGAIVGGADPQINLSSSLSRDPRFCPVRFEGRPCWWLKDEPLPRGGIDMSDDASSHDQEDREREVLFS